MTHDLHLGMRHAIAAHFAGTGGPRSEREMRAHLPVCAECHAYYEQHLLLASLDPAGLSSETRLGRGLGVRMQRAPGRVTFGWFSLCGAAFAALMLFYVRQPHGVPGGRPAGMNDIGAERTTVSPGAAPPAVASRPPAVARSSAAVAEPGSEGELAARGTPAGVAAARAPEVQVYRIYIGRRGTTSEKAGDFVYAGDELAFAYRNPAGKERLLVFAVDEHGHVYWYHPGWSDAGQNPTAVPISAEPGLHELPAAVLHKFDGERIMIHALFTDRELSVRQVESAVASAAARDHAPDAPVPLTLPGATDIVRPLRVVR
jgi:hypothetical protein